MELPNEEIKEIYLDLLSLEYAANDTMDELKRYIYRLKTLRSKLGKMVKKNG